MNENEKHMYAEINRILLNDWDPIGIQEFFEAADEYGPYVEALYQLLITQNSEAKLFAYLWMIETQRMGLQGNREHTLAIAKKLRALMN